MTYILVQEPTAISQAMTEIPALGIGFSICMAFTVIVLQAKNNVFVEWIEEIQDKYPEYISMLRTAKS